MLTPGSQTELCKVLHTGEGATPPVTGSLRAQQVSL